MSNAAEHLGPDAESRAPMAIVTAFGMFSSTMLTLLFVPVLYILIDDLGDFVKRIFRLALGGRTAPAHQTLAELGTSES
jgi:hypothetical protein